MAVTGDGQHVQLWDTATGALMARVACSGSVFAAAPFAAAPGGAGHGGRLVMAHGDAGISEWQVHPRRS